MRCARRAFLSLAVVVLGALAFVGADAANTPKIKVLIVTGFDVGAHPWRQTTERIRSFLEASDRFDVKVVEDVGIFESSTLGNYDVIVNNFGFWEAPELTAAGRAGLLNYVKSGKGLVSLHFACATFQEWGEYVNLIGRVWKKGVGGHGPRGKFTVKIEKPDHPIVAGLKDFEMDDELYAKLTGDAPIEVLASAHSADFSKKVEPIVFTLSYGKGRVVQDVLGHDPKAQESENYQILIRRCVEWAATGKVTVK